MKKNDLAHHGIKGQKWGIRRYQNPDGSLTDAGKVRVREQRNIVRNKPYTDDINDIVRTLSEKDKEFLGASQNSDWINKKYEYDTLKEKANSFVAKNGDVPISFVEIWSNGTDTGQIALATRNDPAYRGKGYASKSMEAAMKWCSKYGKKSLKELEWIADRNNLASINMAKKYGFIEDNPNNHGHDWDWDDNFVNDYIAFYKDLRID